MRPARLCLCAGVVVSGSTRVLCLSPCAPRPASGSVPAFCRTSAPHPCARVSFGVSPCQPVRVSVSSLSFLFVPLRVFFLLQEARPGPSARRQGVWAWDLGTPVAQRCRAGPSWALGGPPCERALATVSCFPKPLSFLTRRPLSSLSCIQGPVGQWPPEPARLAEGQGLLPLGVILGLSHGSAGGAWGGGASYCLEGPGTAGVGGVSQPVR